MPRMYTLEFTRVPAGRPGDALAADVSSSCAVRVPLDCGILLSAA